MTISDTRRGSAAIILVMEHLVLSMSILLARAFMPIMVSMQLASEADSKSVGEKASPFPWLSTGASVIIFVPD